MISYKEALEEVRSLPWPEGVSYHLSNDMLTFSVVRNSLYHLDAINVLNFKDCVNRAMIYLTAVNPAITLRVI